MSEHRRLMQEQAHGYELRLLELRKQLPGGLPLEPPKPSIEKSTVQTPSPPPNLETEPKADLAPEVPPEEESTEDKSELDELREMAEKAGVKVDKRWGADRLYVEIEKAEAESGKG
jgi:hypothetical protein